MEVSVCCRPGKYHHATHAPRTRPPVSASSGFAQSLGIFLESLSGRHSRTTAHAPSSSWLPLNARPALFC